MKKLVNDPRRVVREMLEGLCDLQSGLAQGYLSPNVAARGAGPAPGAAAAPQP